MDRFLEDIAKLTLLQEKIAYKIAYGDNASYLSDEDYQRIDWLIGRRVIEIQEQRKEFYLNKENAVNAIKEAGLITGYGELSNRLVDDIMSEMEERK